ncbi:hypothetical protein N5853_03190 [Bartonella sp. HY329]|uniref:hypothetical protein n=1 Tax=unclassified Bartonella TaxID=2645622 RepID=UPI0021C85DE7|nr:MULTISPECIES: hypothetical protein [unclassified Bartonella]UXM95646.1 hypothetical protein N5853_03190 [Bartonella sp. HY329]UXN09971.1 hypothetical protein N5852_03200 [Bartonella sp. HY328]
MIIQHDQNIISVRQPDEFIENLPYKNVVLIGLQQNQLPENLILNLAKNGNENFFIYGSDAKNIEDYIDDILIDNNLFCTTAAYDELDDCILLFSNEFYQYGKGVVANSSHLIIYDKKYIDIAIIFKNLKKYNLFTSISKGQGQS